ncbi:MAG: ChbG/HpnK family deacetylase [Candidatus Moraniibacteriota bacterium]
MGRPKLIITADDYGMSPRFNQGLLETANAGLITGISVMIKRKYIRKSELLRLRIPLGLHLELGSESTYKEIVSQIKRFMKRFDRLPAYIDGHQHQHLTPKNLGHVIRAAKNFGLPVRSRLTEDRVVLKKSGVITPDNFISWHPSRLPVLAERVVQTKKLPVSELVVHPGYHDIRCRYRYNEEREQELHILHSTHFRKLVRGFQLVSYTDITSPDSHARTTTSVELKKRVHSQAINA